MAHDIALGLTFDDVLLIPQESDVQPSAVELSTKLTKRLSLRMPLLSSAMDTVTEASMAIAMAEAGGLGVLHRNCTIEEQVRMVKEVKRKFSTSSNNILRAESRSTLVAAAVGPHDLDRARALDSAGVDVLVVDCAHAHKPDIREDARMIKKIVKAQLIVGNIATAAAARFLLPVADALKVGVGPGSICTTRIVAGIGVPQLTAIMDVAAAAKRAKVPVIADGGIRSSGDIVKSLAAGASAVMLGGMFAGTDEAPGKLVMIAGKKYKVYRGMGSLPVIMAGKSSDRYFSPSGGSPVGRQKGVRKYVPEGVEGMVAYKGALQEVVFQLLGGLRSGMGYVGASTIAELQRRAQFIRITDSGRRESHPHSLASMKHAPNYKYAPG